MISSIIRMTLEDSASNEFGSIFGYLGWVKAWIWTGLGIKLGLGQGLGLGLVLDKALV